MYVELFEKEDTNDYGLNKNFRFRIFAKIYFRFHENIQTKIYENNENFRENFCENAKVFSFLQNPTFLSKLLVFLQKKYEFVGT
jgi:hypothetical protein